MRMKAGRVIRRMLMVSAFLLAAAAVSGENSSITLNVGPVFSFGSTDIKEYVYAGSSQHRYKLSELDWDMHKAISAGAIFDFKCRYIDVCFQYSQLLQAGKGIMQDYDWQNAADTSHLTNYSQHRNEIAEHRDFAFTAGLPFIQGRFRLALTLGFQYLYTEMDSFDGYLLYETYNWQKILCSGRAISYRQKMEMFWFGVAGDFKVKPKLNISASVAVAPWISTDCYDIHWVRYAAALAGNAVTYWWHDVPNDGIGFKANVSASYDFGRRSMFVITGGFISADEIKGNSYAFLHEEQEFVTYPSSLGGTGYLGWDISFSYRIRIF